MKKSIAVEAALVIAGTLCYSSGAAYAAWQTCSSTVSGDELPTISSGELPSVSGGEGKAENANENCAESILEDEDSIFGVDSVSGGDVSVISLLLPQHLEIVIDPWGMDGRGQIYSEQYVVQNTGKTAGMLLLSGLSCSSGEQEGAVVRMDPQWGEDSREKYVYLEMIFGNGDRVAFSQEGSDYGIRLEPGEELAFWFSGKVNENSSQEWTGGGLEVKAVYSWTAETILPEENSAREER